MSSGITTDGGQSMDRYETFYMRGYETPDEHSRIIKRLLINI